MTMPIEQNGKKIRIYSLLALAFAFVAVVLRTFCLLWFYDKDIGYYTKDALPVLFVALCVLAVVFFLSAVFVVKPCGEALYGKNGNPAIKIASALASVFFAVFFVSLVTSTSIATENVVFDLALKISSLMSIVYFAMNLFAPHTNRVAQTAIGFGIVVWGVCALAITYFDIYVQLNSPEKIILHLALVSCLLFFVSEFRGFVGELKGKIYLFCAFCAAFFSATSSIPYLVTYILGKASSDKYLLYNVVLFALFVYSAASLLSFSFAPCTAAAADNINEENTVNQ